MFHITSKRVFTEATERFKNQGKTKHWDTKVHVNILIYHELISNGSGDFSMTVVPKVRGNQRGIFLSQLLYLNNLKVLCGILLQTNKLCLHSLFLAKADGVFEVQQTRRKHLTLSKTICKYLKF